VYKHDHFKSNDHLKNYKNCIELKQKQIIAKLCMATSFQNKTLHVVLSQLLVSICLFCSHFSLRLWNIHRPLAVAEPRSIMRKEKITGEANNFLIGKNPQRQSDMKLREAHKGV
jgi:hypothetical protein